MWNLLEALREIWWDRIWNYILFLVKAEIKKKLLKDLEEK
jgi:hypothetical protein